MLKYTALIIFNIFILFYNGISQQCYNYHNSCKLPKTKYAYSETNYSTSYSFKAGTTKQIKLSLVSGKDYRITVCSDSVFNKMINIKLINEEERIVYDNGDYKYVLTLEFMSQKQQIAYLELSIPDMVNGDGTIPKGCVGIKIESTLSAKLGF